MNDSIINTQVDSYLILRRIKAGGVAVVYEAIDQALNERVAFKLLQISWVEHEDVVYRFEREAKIMQQLRHPHIVQFRDVGSYQDRPYIVMDYIPGGSLSERLKRIAQIRLLESARLLTQIASALDYAHSKNIVHRDLKPGNILLRDKNHASLTDFGIARILEQTKVTMTGNMPGTPHYMSPEQVRGVIELGIPSDIYSLAVIAYLLSTGSLPFTGTDPFVIINQHLSTHPPIPTKINPELPKALDDILLKALAKAPQNRYPSAGAFGDAYSQAVKGSEEVNVILTFRRKNENLPIQSVIDNRSHVFSNRAIPAEHELTSRPIQQETHTTHLLKRRSTLPQIIIGITIIALLGAVFLANSGGVLNNDENNTAINTNTQATDTQVAIAQIRNTISPTSTKTPVSTDTQIPSPTPPPLATDITTSTPSATTTNTPIPISTSTKTPLPTATEFVDAYVPWSEVERQIEVVSGQRRKVSTIYMPAGCFTMTNNGQRHCFDNPAFILAQLVANVEYNECVQNFQCVRPADSQQDITGARRLEPIVNINWYAAQSFCEIIGGRLPSEQEWEYAAPYLTETNHLEWLRTIYPDDYSSNNDDSPEDVSALGDPTQMVVRQYHANSVVRNIIDMTETREDVGFRCLLPID